MNTRSSPLSPARLSRAIWMPYSSADAESVTDRNARWLYACGCERFQYCDATSGGFNVSSPMRASSNARRVLAAALPKLVVGGNQSIVHSCGGVYGFGTFVTCAGW